MSVCSYLLFFFSLLGVLLGFELRAWCLLDRQMVYRLSHANDCDTPRVEPLNG
jgi:hypothetical protein